MKSNFKKTTLVLSVLSMLGAASSLVSCGFGGNPGVDSTKTQLYVKCYQGGYGNKWLYSAKDRYEALHANDSYENGKTGVQIMISDQKKTPLSAEIKNGQAELYFFEGLNYLNVQKDGAFEEITDLVTGDNPYEKGTSIESKIPSEVANYLNLPDSNGGKHYYAVPHYVGSFGIVYNKTVFKRNNFYFQKNYLTKEPGTDARFVMDATDPKSVGLDGIKGTYDDGLPTTYAEFFELVEYISGSQIPFVWRGEGNGYDYFGSLINSLAASYDGVEQNRVNYSMDGKVNCVKFNAKGDDVQLNADGSPVTEEVTIHPTKQGSSYDGYNVQRMVGKYHALDFVRKLMNNKDSWLCNLVTDSNNHLDAQNFFINSQFGRLDAHGSQKHKSVAMIVEGNWWESEASETIAGLSEVEKSQLDYGWMPLPMADANANSSPITLADVNSFVFIKKGLNDTKRKLAGDFLQYMNTNEAYREFTTITNAIKYFNYDMTPEDETKMSNFGRDFWKYYKSSEVIVPQSHVAQYTNGLGQQLASRRYAITDQDYFPQTQFVNNSSLTAGQYLAKVFKYYKEKIWAGLK